ncbi:hypothetical protein BDM02DRAFT_1857877 [Thelephora ganbajun]|uniref:Uncharacterized protein n=1 Tax=Thelephora ganbajun TaxID=370292 RepID=A0ACB6Z125_THEGA|nr:hypothetical protein BDM02DRAFT_1857877 [Thelephora ganbajun]
MCLRSETPLRSSGTSPVTLTSRARGRVENPLIVSSTGNKLTWACFARFLTPELGGVKITKFAIAPDRDAPSFRPSVKLFKSGLSRVKTQNCDPTHSLFPVVISEDPPSLSPYQGLMGKSMSGLSSLSDPACPSYPMGLSFQGFPTNGVIYITPHVSEPF